MITVSMARRSRSSCLRSSHSDAIVPMQIAKKAMGRIVSLMDGFMGLRAMNSP